MNNYLIDFENVHESGIECILDEKNVEKTIYVFYTSNTPKIDFKYIDMIVKKEVPAGDQSLDIHLISYLGFLIGKHGKKNQYIIVSDDKDYDEIIKYWSAEGYNCIRKNPKDDIKEHQKKISKTKDNSTRKIKKTVKSNNAVNPKQKQQIEPIEAKKDIDIQYCYKSNTGIYKSGFPESNKVAYLKSKGIDEKEAEYINNIFRRFDADEIDIYGVINVLYAWYGNSIEYIEPAINALGYSFEKN